MVKKAFEGEDLARLDIALKRSKETKSSRNLPH
jgi:hypothetical protein